MLWLGFLPFALWPDCGWAVVPVEVVVAFLLLGIEEIGVQIEEAFGILPLEDICIDVMQYVSDLPQHQASIEQLLFETARSNTDGRTESRNRMEHPAAGTGNSGDRRKLKVPASTYSG